MSFDSDVSPVGWYVATYQLRFVELAQIGNEDPECRFLTWENTILVKAAQIDEAYDKAVKFGLENTTPYKGGAQMASKCSGSLREWFLCCPSTMRWKMVLSCFGPSQNER